MASKRIEILKNNPVKFIEDMKRVRSILVYANASRSFFKVTKMEVYKAAETERITYYITDKIYTVKRYTIVIC